MIVEARIVRNDKVVLTRQREYQQPQDLDTVVNEATTEFRKKYYDDSLFDSGFTLAVRWFEHNPMSPSISD